MTPRNGFGTPRKMHAGNRSMGRLISGALSHKQAARESGWKGRLDAITRRKSGFPWVLGGIWRRWFTRLLLSDGEMFYLGVAGAKKWRSGTWKDIL
ncbi:hypothetical protein CDAR_296481 [Caerostris darwini]|uniref:Uncharacterized protein n=1 Tax=Caerostris darwini TaxID=1538125 RepID=A0AAV4PM57_9ARAC|nr:hypothetical protein CDAR_296481 [Caerostris darwini]